ncbi:MAG: NAD(P)/FAD-dependent oxidoreductase [Chloroflexi bacterium]|nr:NAD(P)/FAD-dependent oxidoreductase [Chloroflexota bacterium]
MNTAIIGAGLAGLSAAYDLLNAGHDVVLFEASDCAGGLAGGFQDETWDWPLEKFYHHIFKSDKAIIGLTEEIGFKDKLFFPRPTTSVIHNGRIEPFDSPLRWFTFSGFNLLDTIRFGLVGAYLRFSRPWRKLEQETADSWLQRWYGQKIYKTVWRPLLIGKFGPYYQDVNMAWMWARVHVRSMSLGYYEGGFQAFVDRLTVVVQERGGQVKLNCPVEQVRPQNGKLSIQAAGQTYTFDNCLATTSPGLLTKLAPDLPPDYLGQLLNLKSMGAVALTLALTRPFMPDDRTYWLNIPANTPDKNEGDYPFLALVEHTNFIERKHYNDDHILYCGDYVTPDHPYMSMSQMELEDLFTAALKNINPEFQRDWVRQSWLFREAYAQPVPLLNHSQAIPDIQTPLPGLYFASMSQVYPWDRGTNFAVEIGRKAAAMMNSGSGDRT